MLKSIKQNQSQSIFFFLVAIISLILGVTSDFTTPYLRYDSQAISQQYEIWRLFSANIIHLGWSHLFLNLAGLLLIYVFFSSCLATRYWIFTFFSCGIAISLFVLIFNPEIRWYVGLSGVLHSLFILGGIADIRVRKWEGISFTLIVIIKVVYEQIAGPLPGSEDAAGGPVLVDAHFYGVILGILIAVPIVLNQKRKKQNS